jgi:hypothetical protein
MRYEGSAPEELGPRGNSTEATWLKDLDNAIGKICRYRSMLAAKHAKLCKELVLLRDQPHCEHARIWLRNGHYAYLHVRTPGQERSRTYIGTSVEKIASAEEAVTRGRRVTQLKSSIETIEAYARSYARGLLKPDQRYHD